MYDRNIEIEQRKTIKDVKRFIPNCQLSLSFFRYFKFDYFYKIRFWKININAFSFSYCSQAFNPLITCLAFQLQLDHVTFRAAPEQKQFCGDYSRKLMIET